MNKRNYIIIITLGILFSFPGLQSAAQDEENSENREFNETCLRCHGQRYFYYFNDVTGDSVRKRTYEEFFINRTLFYKSNHKTFKCTDCHSEEFNSYPHPPVGKLEQKYECLDCHEGDESVAMYQFEKIYEEYQGSVHAKIMEDEFTCWKCHSPHEYHISARTQENVLETVAYDNAICLSCHSNIDKFQLLTDKVNPNLVEKHEWLPNQRAHFASVRCIECHTAINNDLLVAHKIVEGEKAVKKCVECHSTDSRLLETLYRYEKKAERTSLGFYNGVILSDSYVIGANRNYFLNVASIGIFALLILGLAAHFILRIIFPKK